MARGYLLAPNGERIVGSLEIVEARANFDTVERLEDGSLEPDYNGSDVFYDSMRTQEREGQLLYLDYNGNEWTQDQLTFVPENAGA